MTKLNISVELPIVDKAAKMVDKIVDRNHIGDLIRVADKYVAKQVQNQLKKVNVKQE